MDIFALGFSLIEEFITPAEEAFLLEHFNKTEKKKAKGRNTIQRFGSSAPYRGNIVSNTVPTYFNFLLDKILENKLLELRPNSVTINEYHAGQEITSHIDSKSSGEVITVLSLMSSATMILAKKEQKHKVVLQPRTIIQMRNEIRHHWTHAIEPVQSLRYSLVFRHGNK